MSFSVCRDYILVSVFATFGVYSIVLMIILLTCSIKRKKRRKHCAKANRNSSNQIEGRRNKVYQEEGEQKDHLDADIRRDRRRQDSGFVASSNESIIPFPDVHETSPKRSPSMPNLPTRSTASEKQNIDEDVFDSAVNLNDPIESLERTKKTKSSVGTQCSGGIGIGMGLTFEKSTSTQSLQLITRKESTKTTSEMDQDKKDMHCAALKKRIESVVIEKKSFNCTGLDFGIAGVYVKDVDVNEITFRKGFLTPGDEVLSINDFPLNGMSDMEAFSFFAKSGPEVQLKILKGGCIAKVENSFIDNDAFTLLDISATSNISHHEDVSTTQTHVKPTSICHERLPRVIADANNLSLDSTVSEFPTKCSVKCCCHRVVHHHPVNLADNPTPTYDPYAAEKQQLMNNRIGFTSLGFEHHFANNIPCSSPAAHTKSSSCEYHRRHISNETQRLSRNTSFDKGRYSSNNTSTEKTRHSNHSSEDAPVATYHLTRAQSEEALKNLVYANGLLQRSSNSGDGQSPVFTVESFNRRPSEGYGCDRDAQSYYQELLRKRNSGVAIDDSGHVTMASPPLMTDSLSSQVTQALLTDNVVLQRGYNNDYIVPISASTQTPRHTFTSKQHTRSRDPSPSRRTPPQSQTSINPRFQNVNLSPLPISAANVVRNVSISSPTSNSTPSSPASITSTPFISTAAPSHVLLQDISRKPPPEYGTSMKRAQEQADNIETLPSSFSSENVEIDADVMRYMTKKYSEPRFTNGHRKNPPPYSGSHTTIPAATSVHGNIDTSGVILRKNELDQSDSARRSRPHSMTETAIYNTTNTLVTDTKSIYVQENRKYPKRTHSLPAVKHLEMRPRSAKTFLNNGSQEAIQAKKVTQKRLRQKQRIDSINRRKSIDSGTLRKLAEEIQVNPSLGGEYPIIAQLLGESQYSASERRAQGLYRHKSTEALANQIPDDIQSEF